MRAHQSILFKGGALALALGLTAACSGSSEKKSGDGNKAANGANTTSETPTSSVVSESVSDFYGNAFYTGYDGTTDFSLLMPSFATYRLDANSIAKIEEIQVKLSDTVVNNLITKAKAANPNLDTSRMTKMFSRTQTTYKITPLQSGKTKLTQEARKGRDNSSWKQGSVFTLVVNSYTPEQIAAGKARYNSSGSGNLRACASCHESGGEGAPPHELGRIMEISDDDALTWITTGAIGGRKAKVNHTWEFNNDDERNGIVAYLRSKQTHDTEQLAALLFEEFLAGGGGMPPPPGGPGGNSNSTTTSTSTN